MTWTAKPVPVDEHASALLDEPDPAQEKQAQEHWDHMTPEQKAYVHSVEARSQSILTKVLGAQETRSESRTQIKAYDGKTGKGFLDGTSVITWQVDKHPRGAPHHKDVKRTLGVDHPTVDFHLYPDHTFAMWAHRGLVGEPADAAKVIARATGYKWLGKTIEEVEGVNDRQTDNPKMTFGADSAKRGDAWVDEPRDPNGEWTTDGGSATATADEERPEHPDYQRITVDEARDDSRRVSVEEYDHLAAEGKEILATNHLAISGVNAIADEDTHTAFQECMKSWGGVTMDVHGGGIYNTDQEKYIMSVKTPGSPGTLSISEKATEEEFARAMDQAQDRFYHDLRYDSTYLGVFHDDDEHRIDFDPVTIFDSQHEVEAVGAYTHAIGGAYDTATGNGVFPPHVGNEERADKPNTLLGKLIHFSGLGAWWHMVTHPMDFEVRRSPLARLKERRDWDEAQHPRGNPGNAGQFSAKPDAGKDDTGSTKGAADSASQPQIQSLTASLTGRIEGGEVVHVPPEVAQDLVRSFADRDNPINMMYMHVDGAGNERLFDTSARDIPRDQMPVIPGQPDEVQQFADHLAANGITASYELVDPRELTATQNQLDGVKVAGIYGSMVQNGGAAMPTLVTDQEGNLLDGHHRWAAEAMYSIDHVYQAPILRCSTDIDTLMGMAHEWDASKGIVTKPFGQRSIFGTQPRRQPPTDNEPWLWFNGQWILLATDDSDGVPRKLDIPPLKK